MSNEVTQSVGSPTNPVSQPVASGGRPLDDTRATDVTGSGDKLGDPLTREDLLALARRYYHHQELNDGILRCQVQVYASGEYECWRYPNDDLERIAAVVGWEAVNAHI
jgi:hypothetical protein